MTTKFDVEEYLWQASWEEWDATPWQDTSGNRGDGHWVRQDSGGWRTDEFGQVYATYRRMNDASPYKVRNAVLERRPAGKPERAER